MLLRNKRNTSNKCDLLTLKQLAKIFDADIYFSSSWHAHKCSKVTTTKPDAAPNELPVFLSGETAHANWQNRKVPQQDREWEAIGWWEQPCMAWLAIFQQKS